MIEEFENFNGEIEYTFFSNYREWSITVGSAPDGVELGLGYDTDADFFVELDRRTAEQLALHILRKVRTR